MRQHTEEGGWGDRAIVVVGGKVTVVMGIYQVPCWLTSVALCTVLSVLSNSGQ